MENRFNELYELENNRLDQIDTIIEDLFGHLSPDEIEMLWKQHSRTETRMIEVVDVKSKSLTVIDLCEDIEFKNVIFPPKLTPLLQRQDTFLATFGLDGNHWKIIYMSNSYRTGHRGDESIGRKSANSTGAAQTHTTDQQKDNIC